MSIRKCKKCIKKCKKMCIEELTFFWTFYAPLPPPIGLWLEGPKMGKEKKTI